ncbi:MAG: hypothetical protein IPG22_19520 [Acidobacteria bacterium]|nr:hypothetical protein [Acidobacteriota bacterium]
MERNRTGQLNIARDLVSQIAKNMLMASPTIQKWRLKRPRTAIETENVDQFLKNNAFASLDLLRKYAGDLTGRSVCEIGAGDYLTSGLSILGSWGKQIRCDRQVSRRLFRRDRKILVHRDRE